MARGYMQDITPPEDDSGDMGEPHMAPERSIRDIQPTPARMRMQQRHVRPQPRVERAPRRRGRWGLWAIALVSIVVLGGAAALVIFPSTSVAITPHTQIVPFDPATPFTAYPDATAATGTIRYTAISQVFEDSAVVPATGVENAEEKATGQITIYNAYSDTNVRLIKNTRFQAPGGLVFRIPASVDVPGKTAAAPGSITVTVFADQPGEEYNLPPQDMFTLPGLKSTPDMYDAVYAKSTEAFTGGFSGERPAVDQATLDAARSEIRSRLDEKARQLAATAPEGSFAFSGLTNISYETLPPTAEPGGGVRIHEKATVVLPVFPADAFAQSLGQAVSASAEGQSLAIRFAEGVTAAASTTLAQGEYGQKPLVFTLSGRGQLIWKIDGPTLAQALAGRDEDAFQAIIQGFPGVEEARARITPFWKHTFPSDPAKIDIEVQEPPQPF